MAKYTLRTSKQENKPGQWNSTICEIYLEDQKVGQFVRHYPSHSESTFCPFTFNGKDYALFSSNYTKISLMELPSCKEVKIKDECVSQMANFCPVEIYVPMYEDSTYKEKKYRSQFKPGDERDENGDVAFSTLAFALGCVWGDDTSMKLMLIDLRGIEQGELWFINNKLERKWLYQDFPDALHLKDIEVEFNEDENFPWAYNQLIQSFQNFEYNKEMTNEQNPERSVATDDAQSSEAG